MALKDILTIGIEELTKYCMINNIAITVGDGMIRKIEFEK